MPTRQAGRPSIDTVEDPGPGASGVPWLVMSPMRAAGWPIGMSIDVHEGALERQRRTRLDVDSTRGFERNLRCLQPHATGRANRQRPARALNGEGVSTLVL